MAIHGPSMLAARVHRFGPPAVIVLDELDTPVARPGEVVVRVKAAGVGPWDAWIRAGRSVLPQPLPLTLGSDLAGTVAAVGAGVTGLTVGDEVFGVTNRQFTGAYAEYAAAEASRLVGRPSRLGVVEAASAPVVAVTAQQMLFDHARVTAGQRVLVHGGGGSVGGYAVQLARQAGAHVVATARGRGAERARGLGADEVIDTATTRFEDAIAPVDAVLDTVGGDVLARSFAVLAPGGTLVSAVAAPDPEEARRRGVTAAFMLVDVTRDALAPIAQGFAEGRLTPDVGTVLPLAEARQAHELLDGVRPHGPGKIVLRVAA